MRRVLAILVALYANAARADRALWKWAKPDALETTLHVAAMAAVLLDASTTLDIKNHRLAPPFAGQEVLHIDGGMYETNPLLGQHPSDLRVVAYAGSVLVLHTALWYVAPPGLRLVLDAATIAVETPFVVRNFSLGCRLRVPF